MNSTPAYVLNTPHFEALLRRYGYENKQQFIHGTGIPRSTFNAVLGGERELNTRTISYFLNAFDGVTFEYLFEPAEETK